MKKIKKSSPPHPMGPVTTSMHHWHVLFRQVMFAAIGFVSAGSRGYKHPIVVTRQEAQKKDRETRQKRENK